MDKELRNALRVPYIILSVSIAYDC
jgi:hypothetical protein